MPSGNGLPEIEGKNATDELEKSVRAGQPASVCQGESQRVLEAIPPIIEKVTVSAENIPGRL